MSDHLTDEDLDAIEARANAATEGTWHHGDRTHIQGAKFCQCLERNGPLIWEGPRTINGQRMQAHVHRKETADPDDHSVFVETENGGFVVAYSTFEYVPISPEDAEFIAHARTDVPALVAEVRRLRATEERVRALHRVFGVYDECECDDPELDGLHAEVEEVGLTCNRLYSICEECCTDDGYQRVECADYHDHSADEVYHCPTIRALDGGDDE